MNSNYSTSSRLQRILAALAATLVTGTLFAVVAFGLTNDEGWGVFAKYDNGAAADQPA